MIPKIIHYCWFGNGELTKLAQKCIASWEKYCPEYTIKRWDENVFDVSSNRYVKEAYEAGKWAFVTDYVRLYALLREGGIYMDTDVEVVKSLDTFLNHKAFSGFQKTKEIPTGIMAGEAGFGLFQELLNDYEDRSFILPGKRYNDTNNVTYITNTCLLKGLKLNNQYQEIEGFALYPSDYFCAKDYLTGELKMTDRTCTIHHFAGSWVSPKIRKWVAFSNSLSQRFGERKTNAVMETFPLKAVRHLYIRGIRESIKDISMYLNKE